MYFVVNKLMRTTAMTAVSFLTVIGHAYAADVILPVNGQVVGGAATISNLFPNKMDIYQTTNRAVINWDSFNIGENGTVQFYQPDANSWVINRVVGNNSDPTKIIGSLKANGGVMVLDRNGVIFGKNAIVDVGSIIASTGDINTNVFMHGDTKFNITGMSGSATVRNDGQITVADGGLAALVAPTVRNDGTITAHAGKIALVSGKQVAVDFYGDDLLNLTVAPDSADARIINNGTLDAAGGRVEVKMDISRAADILSSVVNNKGVVHASTARMVGNKIVLSAGNAPVTVQGDIQSGKTVSVKGGMVDVRAGSSINAGSAHETGDVVVLGTKKLTFNGYINANYGSIQTSGTTGLAIGKGAEVHGSNWLIGSPSVNIRDEAESGTIYVDALEDALNEGMDVTLRAVKAQGMKGNIDLYTPLNWSGTASLILDAAGDIHFRNDAGIMAEGKADITLKAGDDIRFTKLLGNGISTNGGDINLSSGDLTVLLANNIVNAHGGNITIDNKGALLAAANTIVTEGHGTITVNQNKTSEIISAALALIHSIQGALDAIKNTGDGLNTIHVGEGAWARISFIKDNILLSGAGKTKSFLSGIDIFQSQNIKINEMGIDYIAAGDTSGITLENNNIGGIFGIYVDNLLVASNQVGAIYLQNNLAKYQYWYPWFEWFEVSEFIHSEVYKGGNITISDNNILGGIDIQGNHRVVLISGNTITNPDNIGISIDETHNPDSLIRQTFPTSPTGNEYDLKIANNVIENSEAGIVLTNVAGKVVIDSNVVNNAKGSAIDITSGYGTYLSDGDLLTYNEVHLIDSLTVTNNQIYTPEKNGINIETKVDNAFIDKNSIAGSGESGIRISGLIKTSYSGVEPNNDYKTLIVSNNNISNSPYAGMTLSALSGNINITDNTILNSGMQGIVAEFVNSGVHVSQRGNQYNFATGIKTSAGKKLTVGNNVIDGVLEYHGIYLFNTGDEVNIGGNTLSNLSADGIFAIEGLGGGLG